MRAPIIIRLLFRFGGRTGAVFSLLSPSFSRLFRCVHRISGVISHFLAATMLPRSNGIYRQRTRPRKELESSNVYLFNFFSNFFSSVRNANIDTFRNKEEWGLSFRGRDYSKKIRPSFVDDSLEINRHRSMGRVHFDAPIVLIRCDKKRGGKIRFKDNNLYFYILIYTLVIFVKALTRTH